jgi:Arc-like DNA binding domain
LEGQTVDVDLFIKKMPHVVKELISREAFDNRRSINQEAIALLEEALVNRVGAVGAKRKQMEALLADAVGSHPSASLNHSQP